MAKNKNKKKVSTNDSQVIEIVEEWIEYICPKRGKVRELVKVKKLKKVSIEQKSFIASNDLIEDIESKEGDTIVGSDIED